MGGLLLIGFYVIHPLSHYTYQYLNAKKIKEISNAVQQNIFPFDKESSEQVKNKLCQIELVNVQKDFQSKMRSHKFKRRFAQWDDTA